MAEPKYRYYMVDLETGENVEGREGYINAVSGQGEYLEIPETGLEIEDPGVLESEDFQRNAGEASHPLQRRAVTSKKKES